MRFVVLLMGLLVPAAALAQVTTKSAPRQMMSSEGASTVGATPTPAPAPKKKPAAKKKKASTPAAEDGPVTLEPNPNGTVDLVPPQKKPSRPDQGTVTLEPHQSDVATLKPQSQLLPFTEEKKPVGTLLPFTPEPETPATKKSGSSRAADQRLRDALQSDHAESEAESAKAEKALLAINAALDRSDYARVAKLLAVAIEDQRTRSAQLAKRKSEIARLLATSK